LSLSHTHTHTQTHTLSHTHTHFYKVGAPLIHLNKWFQLCRSVCVCVCVCVCKSMCASGRKYGAGVCRSCAVAPRLSHTGIMCYNLLEETWCNNSILILYYLL